jgi:hypothetical protein
MKHLYPVYRSVNCLCGIHIWKTDGELDEIGDRYGRSGNLQPITNDRLMIYNISMFDVIAFDADDTLWHNGLYLCVQDSLGCSPIPQPEWIEQKLYETEMKTSSSGTGSSHLRCL